MGGVRAEATRRQDTPEFMEQNAREQKAGKDQSAERCGGPPPHIGRQGDRAEEEKEGEINWDDRPLDRPDRKIPDHCRLQPAGPSG